MSNRGIHAITMLTKHLANNYVNTYPVRTLGDPEYSLPHFLACMVNILVCAFVIPDGVETTSNVLGARTPRKDLQGQVTLP